VDRTLALMAYALGAGRIASRVEIPAELPPLDVDASRIQQVLVNIVLNGIQAIKETGGRGEIAITAERVPGEANAGRDAVRIRISDTGPGVHPDVVPRLFEPFYTSRGVGQGSGLGLSVSYGIVAAHGGRLWYEPRPGGGSIFTLELPAAGRRTAEEPTVTANDRPLKVLAVDDEPALRALIGRTLGRLGHVPVVAGSAAEALEATSSQVFDLVLLDHRMPGTDGAELFRILLERDPSVAERTIVMSGDVMNPAIREFAEAHGLPLLAKPFGLEELRALIGEFVAPQRG
jgi:CheY-like chemotaxis protein